MRAICDKNTLACDVNVMWKQYTLSVRGGEGKKSQQKARKQVVYYCMSDDDAGCGSWIGAIYMYKRWHNTGTHV